MLVKGAPGVTVAIHTSALFSQHVPWGLYPAKHCTHLKQTFICIYMTSCHSSDVGCLNCSGRKTIVWCFTILVPVQEQLVRPEMTSRRPLFRRPQCFQVIESVILYRCVSYKINKKLLYSKEAWQDIFKKLWAISHTVLYLSLPF